MVNDIPCLTSFVIHVEDRKADPIQQYPFWLLHSKLTTHKKLFYMKHTGAIEAIYSDGSSPVGVSSET